MAQGLNAIRNDQCRWLGTLLKQLKNDFLLYGKFNVAKLQDIVQNSKRNQRNRTLSLEKLLTGQDLCTLQTCSHGT